MHCSLVPGQVMKGPDYGTRQDVLFIGMMISAAKARLDIKSVDGRVLSVGTADIYPHAAVYYVYHQLLLSTHLSTSTIVHIGVEKEQPSPMLVSYCGQNRPKHKTKHGQDKTKRDGFDCPSEQSNAALNIPFLF